MEKSPAALSHEDILLRQFTCDILCALISGRNLDPHTTSYEYITRNDLPKAQYLAQRILKDK